LDPTASFLLAQPKFGGALLRLDKIRGDFQRPLAGIERLGFHRIRAMYAGRVESGFQCASCGEWNATSVDESAGRRQSYVEDCQVCCKPNVLRVEYDVSSQEFFIIAELE
jgi:hypothetical protein